MILLYMNHSSQSTYWASLVSPEPGSRFTNIYIKLCEEWQPYLRYVKSYGQSAIA